MKNSEIFQFIDYFCAQKKKLDISTNADLVYTILAHAYLYVRPGKPTEKFISRVIKALKYGATDGIKNYFKDEYCSWPLDEWIRICVAKNVLKIARAACDKEYFKNQIARLDPDEECDDSILDKYLKLMDKEQIMDFINEVSHCRAWYLAFTTFNIEAKVIDELHERCRKVNPSLPESTSGFDYLSFRENSPCYMFDYLSKEEIIGAISKEIIMDRSLAGHVARVLYYGNSIDYLEPYIELIGTYERVFKGDIYKPHIVHETLYLN